MSLDMDVRVKTKIINDEVFKFGWMIVYGGKLENAIKQYAKHLRIDPWTPANKEPDGHFTAHRDFGKGGLIWFKSNKPGIGIVAHEVYHAVTGMMAKMDCKPEENTEEFGAYYTQFLIDKIIGK